LAPWPLPVRWTITGRARGVMASWSAIRGAPAADEPIDLAGEYVEVADVFARLDAPRRLVLIGEPGAGKSTLVMRLVLDLLDRRTGTEPVPVLLAAASWD